MEMNGRIKERRIAMGYTQEELATMLGLQKSAIAKYESGRVENIKRSVIKKMSEILNCQPCYLLGWSDDLGNAEMRSESPSLAPEEMSLLEKYRRLMPNNRDKLQERAEELLELQRARQGYEDSMDKELA